MSDDLDRCLNQREVDSIVAELLAADLASPGALPLTEEDDAALARIRQAVLEEAAKPRRAWWRWR